MLRESLELAQKVVHNDTATFFQSYIPEVARIDRWSEDVASRLEEYALRPGKAVRPLLTALGASLARGQTLEEVINEMPVRRLMMVVELTHKRLILADDIADQDEMRNEKPAFHVLFENDLAKRPAYARLRADQRAHIARSYSEVAGIWLQSLTWKILQETTFSPEVRASITQILLQCVYEKTSAGWYILLDQNFEALSEQSSEDRLLKGLELVTGEYTFVAPLLMGATAMNGSEELLLSLTRYGRKAGLLFQITDDVLGLFGDSEKTGKPSGNDVREGKKTLLVQYAYRNGSEQQKAFLEKAVGNASISPEEIQEVREIVIATGALEQTKEVIATLVKEASQAVQDLPDSASRQTLVDLVQFLASREK